MQIIKPGVNIFGTKTEMLEAHCVVASIFDKYGYDCVVTSAVRESGNFFSLHPHGYARDYRAKHIKTWDEKAAIEKELKSALPICDVDLKNVDDPNSHYHVEYDPKDDKAWQTEKSRLRAEFLQNE